MDTIVPVRPIPDFSLDLSEISGRLRVKCSSVWLYRGGRMGRLAGGNMLLMIGQCFHKWLQGNGPRLQISWERQPRASREVTASFEVDSSLRGDNIKQK